jgi:hypothetical protein
MNMKIKTITTSAAVLAAVFCLWNCNLLEPQDHPMGLTATKGEHTDHIDLSWTGVDVDTLNGGSVDGYWIEYDDGSGWQVLDSTTGTTFTVQADGSPIARATPYDFRVFAEILDADGFVVSSDPSNSDTGFALDASSLQFYTNQAAALDHVVTYASGTAADTGWYKVEVQKGFTYHFTGTAAAFSTVDFRSTNDLSSFEIDQLSLVGGAFDVTWPCTSTAYYFLHLNSGSITFASYYTF